MSKELEKASEIWYVYALPPRGGMGDVTLPVTTYMACKRSERDPRAYERAWQRYLVARRTVMAHPYYARERRGEPRIAYDIVVDDVCWLFLKEGVTFMVSSRARPELESLRFDKPDLDIPLSVQVDTSFHAA